MPPAEDVLISGKAALVFLSLVGVCIYLVRRLAASKESPDERAHKALMRAIEEVAKRIESIEKNTGRPCAFLDGEIPPHVERWAQSVCAEAEARRRRR